MRLHAKRLARTEMRARFGNPIEANAVAARGRGHKMAEAPDGSEASVIGTDEGYRAAGTKWNPHW